MNRAAIWITLAVLLFVAALGTAAYVWHRARNELVVVDTREVLGHPALTSIQRVQAIRTLTILERDTNGPLQRYRAVARAHTLSAYGSLGNRSVRGTVRPFPGEVADLETDLWARLALELDPERVRELQAADFALDAFPFGRAQYEFSMSELDENRCRLEITGPAGTREVSGVLGLDGTLSEIVHK